MPRARNLGGAKRRVVVAVIAGLAVGCRALLDMDGTANLDDGGAGVTESGAPEAEAGPLRDGSAPLDSSVACPTDLPPEGVYSYSTVSISLPGREKMISLNADGTETDAAFIDQAMGPTFAATIRHSGDGGFTYRVDYNSIHFDQYSFVSGANAGLRASNVTENLLGLPISVTCSPPVDVIRCPMVLGATWLGAGTGTFNKNDFDAELSYTFTDIFEWAVGGVLVPTYHVVESRSLSRALKGTEANEYWFAVKDGLLIHSKSKVGDINGTTADGIVFSLFGPAEYKELIEFSITSLTPAPLPPTDAGLDGG